MEELGGGGGESLQDVVHTLVRKLEPEINVPVTLFTMALRVFVNSFIHIEVDVVGKCCKLAVTISIINLSLCG